ncbi:lipase esterase protein [Rutstroemia sp. NJR-2017a BBW]|nr:lipase esterase protein [Rutstroemia sp. NJR-2017a BBW]
MDEKARYELPAIIAKMREVGLTAAANMTVTAQQNSTVGESPIKGPMWVSKFHLSAPENDIVQELALRVIDELGNPIKTNSQPASVGIDVEWVGYRSNVDSNAPEPPLSELENYHNLMGEAKNKGVVIYVYGGAFYLNAPARYRKITARLSKMTGLPCMMVRQRLAPQHPFPAALIDVFRGYMSLLSPHPSAPNSAFPGSSIVLAGDSSGANLALGLLQILLTLRRKGITSLEYHGRKVTLDLPAGLTLLSAVGELTNTLPSYKHNASHDVFPRDLTPTVLPGFPVCAIWPSKPPRGNIYCEGPVLAHPIASPACAEDWTGSPFMWFSSGQEQIVDGAKVIAKTAFSQGVQVVFREYEGMPHTFMWHLPGTPQSEDCWKAWAEACRSIIMGTIGSTSEKVFIDLQGTEAHDENIKQLTSLTREEASEIIKQGAKRYKPFTGKYSSL